MALSFRQGALARPPCHAAAAQNSRSLVESLLESDGVDDDAAAAWHAASARKKIAGALPGGAYCFIHPQSPLSSAAHAASLL